MMGYTLVKTLVFDNYQTCTGPLRTPWREGKEGSFSGRETQVNYPKENTYSQVGTESPINEVPPVRFEPGGRGGRQGKIPYSNLITI